MANKIKMPIKYKFLAVILFITVIGLATFFVFANNTFSDDKRMVVREMNLSNMKAASSELTLQLRIRTEELHGIITRAYQSRFQKNKNSTDEVLKGVTSKISSEVLNISFNQMNLETKSNETVFQWKNSKLLETKGWDDTFLTELTKSRPLTLADININETGMEIINRSFNLEVNGKATPIPVLTFVFLSNNSLEFGHKNGMVVVDILQDFLVDTLKKESDYAEVFLISKHGNLVGHSSPQMLVDFAITPLNHPIVDILKSKKIGREALDLKVGNEEYLCATSETGINDIFAVSQIKKSIAFDALKRLKINTLFLAMLILCFAVIFSILFANRLTSNIQKLKEAAEEIGKGNFDVELYISSNDEVQNVAESFGWMTNRITELIKESAEKVRMEDELKTARLVQATVLNPPKITNSSIEVAPFYKPATECGGDFWDVSLVGNKLTLIVGDATGHGAPAAIVTAVAKSCFSTLNSIYSKVSLTPEQILRSLNAIIFNSCKGQLLMTANLVQLDLITGELIVCNAGHESPMLLRVSDGQEKPETLFCRGERLGYQAVSHYTSEHYTIKPNDILFLYSDGVSEAQAKNGKEFSERKIKKILSKNGKSELSLIKNEIEKEIENHLDGAAPKDDITFVLLKWKGIVTEAERVDGSRAA